MVSTLVYDIVFKFISAVACLHNLVQPPVRTVPRKITSKSGRRHWFKMVFNKAEHITYRNILLH